MGATVSPSFCSPRPWSPGCADGPALDEVRCPPPAARRHLPAAPPPPPTRALQGGHDGRGGRENKEVGGVLRCYDRVTPASSPVIEAIVTTLSSGKCGGGDGRQARQGAPPRPRPPSSVGFHPTAIVGVWWRRRRRALLGSHPARLPSRVHHVAPSATTRCWWRPPRPPAAKRGSLAGNARSVIGRVGANQGSRMGFPVATRLWRGRRRGRGGGRRRVADASVAGVSV